MLVDKLTALDGAPVMRSFDLSATAETVAAEPFMQHQETKVKKEYINMVVSKKKKQSYQDEHQHFSNPLLQQHLILEPHWQVRLKKRDSDVS